MLFAVHKLLYRHSVNSSCCGQQGKERGTASSPLFYVKGL